MIAREVDGWIHRRWVYDGGEDERRYRFVGGRLVAWSHVYDGEPALETTCELDADGRPLRSRIEDAETIWHYGPDGALRSVEHVVRGHRAVSALTRGPNGEWILDDVSYSGDCAEQISWECSAVSNAFEGRLPDGILPR